ncbi:PucR family transcriptional regulator [Alkalicoccobacillus plakortidis]|uniref:PucR family transcriptional regulator ligand-binding domain-containing protein n=1 Tax=Alkalicoccobacillus plakortidis TaxID=444060 RepID=A0ABT0XIA9_9BACI|nr:PucR family transcriptional regulator [Alkalicoccobacillus plakortidis]MCM2675651.1 PucR family transcriptional regulator ligand-binding domain-containing protein [Alkalicoccobacillus plakortidis]
MRDVVDLEIMEPSVVQTASSSLDERVVEWVSITEAPVENFVRKNEMVLTTGIGYAQAPQDFYEFVQDVIQSGASGLGVATGKYIVELCDRCVDMAEEHDFPIVFLPWEIRFADVTQSITQKITDLKQGYIHELQSIQQELLSMVLEGATLSQLAEHVAKQLRAPVYLTDKNGGLKGSSEVDANELQKWSTLFKEQANQLARPLEEQDHPLLTKVELGTCEAGSFLRLPIAQSSNNIQGYVYSILAKDQSMVPAAVFIILEHVVTASAFWFLRENAVLEAEAKVKDHFVWELAKDHFHTNEEMLTRAQTLGYNLELPYVAIVGYPNDMKQMFQSGESSATQNDWMRSMAHYIEEEVLHVAKSIKRKAMATFQASQIIIFLEITEEAGRETVHSFLDLMNRRLITLLPSVDMFWGVGDGAETTFSFSRSFEQANQALHIGKRRKDISRRVFYSDTRVDRVLQAMGEYPELRDVVTDIIKPLYQYDQQRNMDLIGTFTTYHRNQSKVSQTARVLHLHRQSLLYRLRKIESLTQLSLANPDDVFLLELSIRIWHLQVVEKG